MSDQKDTSLTDAQQMAALLLEAQQALTEARQITDDPAVLVCLLRVEHCLLRIGLLRQGSSAEHDQGNQSA